MWKCPNCHESLATNFLTCWNCGSDANGKVDTSFAPQEDVLEETAPLHVERAVPRSGFQFSIRGLLVLTTLTCFAITALTWSRGYRQGIAVALLINLLGFAIGWIVTHVFKFPNDGSRIWTEKTDLE